MKQSFLLLLLIASTATTAMAGITPVPEKIPWVVADRQEFQLPDRVTLDGWVGTRVSGNEANRLAKIDPARLLEGYRKRPGRQSWDGEHVGKWLHAATLAWVNTGDPALRQKLDYVVAELCKCQLPDGYLGTYLDKDRWTEWDVWAHKYNLIGLITYMRYTGNMDPLPTCRKMADLLCTTFGEGKRDIITAGHHVGMAPTSVLESMVLIYRLTGDPRYLDFCKYILRAWEQPNGPHIVTRLLELKRVDKVGNGKAYEMLSCLNGALEYYRVTGDKQILDACLNAWSDIVAKRLYITGTASYGEHFHDDYDLPNTGSVGETCVTVTWLQFNAHLLRLTGEARFAEQLERVVLNQLPGAQRPDCAAWGYYVEMEGKKPYSDSLDGHCCLSSGPRGVALIPTFALTTDADGVVVNLYDDGSANLALHDSSKVAVAVKTMFPSDGNVRIAINPATSKTFAVKLRLPEWSPTTTVKVNGETVAATRGADGYAAIKREWKQGDTIEAAFTLAPRLIVGDHRNAGKVALMYGPLVLAADNALLADLGQTVSSIGVAPSTTPDIVPLPAPASVKTWPGAKVYQISAVARKSTDKIKAGETTSITLIPFADAGGTGSNYKIWLSQPHQGTASLLLDARESRSRQGNVGGSINDEDENSYSVTFDGKPAAEDWFALTTEHPVDIKRITFMHGKTFHDGGWFDASKTKPQVQVQREKGGNWETVGELKDYPATSAKDSAGLRSGQAFQLTFPEKIHAVAIRVIGTPASGDNPAQSFASCAELQAFGE